MILFTLSYMLTSQKTKMLMIPKFIKIILSDYEISDPPEQGDAMSSQFCFCAKTKNERAVQCSHESSRDRSGSFQIKKMDEL